MATDFKQFASDLQTLCRTADEVVRLRNEVSDLRRIKDDKEKRVKELTRQSNLFNKLLSLTGYSICNLCGGDGGWVIGDEISGYDSGECEDCNGSGFIKQTKGGEDE